MHETHSVDGGERGTESEVHTLPHTRGTAGSADHGGGGGTTKGLGGASKSKLPEEKLCGLCITSKCCMCVCVCDQVHPLPPTRMHRNQSRCHEIGY